MIVDEVIKKILEAGVRAPSGGNSQPWRFRVRDNQIEIIALPEKDHPVLNYRHRGTWLAHGTLIENMAIAASALGYELETELFPDSAEPNLTARIILKQAVSTDVPLYPYIALRATNRKPYKDILLSDNQKSEILNISNEAVGAEIKLVEDREKMRILGGALSAGELVMFENKTLHKLLFKEISWTEKEEKERGGLYVKTMELKPPQEMALKIFRYWPIMNIFNKLGVAKSIAKDNAKIYSSGAALGAVLIRNQDENFILAGRLVERIWLKATQMGLNFHLITGVLFLWQKIAAGESEIFSGSHVNLVKKSYESIAEAFGAADNKIIALVFRIGAGDKPSARSSRLPPKVEIIS